MHLDRRAHRDVLAFDLDIADVEANRNTHIHFASRGRCGIHRMRTRSTMRNACIKQWKATGLTYPNLLDFLVSGHYNANNVVPTPALAACFFRIIGGLDIRSSIRAPGDAMVRYWTFRCAGCRLPCQKDVATAIVADDASAPWVNPGMTALLRRRHCL